MSNKGRKGSGSSATPATPAASPAAAPAAASKGQKSAAITAQQEKPIGGEKDKDGQVEEDELEEAAHLEKDEDKRKEDDAETPHKTDKAEAKKATRKKNDPPFRGCAQSVNIEEVMREGPLRFTAVVTMVDVKAKKEVVISVGDVVTLAGTAKSAQQQRYAIALMYRNANANYWRAVFVQIKKSSLGDSVFLFLANIWEHLGSGGGYDEAALKVRADRERAQLVDGNKPLASEGKPPTAKKQAAPIALAAGGELAPALSGAISSLQELLQQQRQLSADLNSSLTQVRLRERDVAEREKQLWDRLLGAHRPHTPLLHHPAASSKRPRDAYSGDEI
jgi:hypothetical protein